MLPPLLALLPRGAAPLVAVAGLCAAGLIAARPPVRLASLGWLAALLGLLWLWGGASAAWSIDPARSVLMETRLAGLFLAALALAGAADRLAAPRRLSRLIVAGTAVGIALALCDLASGGELTRYVSVRAFAGPRLNQLAVWLAILVLPAAALAGAGGRRLPGLALAAVMAGTVCVLDDTTAKLALVLSLPVAALLYLRRRLVARLAAALAILAILTAPVTLPRLDRLPGVFAAADSFKDSAGHRLLIWSFAGRRIAERPLAGWGLDSSRAIPGGKVEIRPGQSWLPLHPHNAALQVWLELGAPGALLFALLVARLWLALAAAPWPPAYAAAAGGGLVAALVAAFSGWGIWEEWWLATLGLAAFAIIAMARAATLPPPPGRHACGR